MVSVMPLPERLNSAALPGSATMRGRPDRPSTANTMVLVLKPRVEEYKNTVPLTASENEREAWRKNKVMQMKLSAYLTEVCLQERSSARLLKTEEGRFLQEVNRRSSVPRSVMMLQQLQNYTNKTFPNASYSYDTHTPTVNRGRFSSLFKHAPLSARGPTRARPQPLLDRPQTSVSVFRKALTEGDKEAEDFNEEILEPTPEQRQITEQIFSLSTNEPMLEQSFSKQVTELPSIKTRESRDSVFRESRPKDTDSETGQRSSSSVERPSKILQKRDSQSRASSLSRLASVSRFAVADLPTHEETENVETASVDSFVVDPKVEELLADEIRAFESGLDVPPPPSANDLEEVFPLEETPKVTEVSNENEDEQLGIIDLDDEPLIERPRSVHKPKIHKRGQKTHPAKTNFNRLKTEPVMPLRHNITSVLRQERLLQEKSRYQESQSKIKDYLHKMTPKDFMTRPQNHRDTASAQSRRTASRKSLT